MAITSDIIAGHAATRSTRGMSEQGVRSSIDRRLMMAEGGMKYAYSRDSFKNGMAKVFINWLLSRNGQIAFQKFGGGAGDPFNSGRVDIPKEGIPPEGRPMKGKKYVDLARPKYADTGPFFSFVKEIMRESRHKR